MSESPALARFSEIIGNERARTLLRRSVIEGRLLPALLLHGPAGVGKFTTARAMAAALNCKEPSSGEACGRCSVCGKIAGWTHPDIKVLENEAAAATAGRPVFFPSGKPGSSTRPGTGCLW